MVETKCAQDLISSVDGGLDDYWTKGIIFFVSDGLGGAWSKRTAVQGGGRGWEGASGLILRPKNSLVVTELLMVEVRMDKTRCGRSEVRRRTIEAEVCGGRGDIKGVR